MNSGDIIDAFPQVQKWTTNMIDSISQDSIGPISTAACVQFSGFSSPNLGRVESGRSLVIVYTVDSTVRGNWTVKRKIDDLLMECGRPIKSDFFFLARSLSGIVHFLS